MCLEYSNNTTMEYNNKESNTKISHCIKKVLKRIFKKQKTEEKIDNVICKTLSLDSFENVHNAEAEIKIENEANEYIYTASSCGLSIASEDQYTETEINVPVHFTRTEHGTFFWSATSSTPADADLIEPLYCCTDNQIAAQQWQNRWAAA